MELVKGQIESEHVKTLQEVEKKHILSVFFKYKFSECPKILGISRATLYRRLKDYGIIRGVKY